MVKYTLQNSRKKTTKRKTVTKRRNMKRKTRRRKVAGAPDVFTRLYRTAHKGILRRESKGEKSEIDAAAKAADLAELEKLKKNPDYTEVNDIEEFKVGSTYVQFQGAGAELKHLGHFKNKSEFGAGGNNLYKITLIFENGKLGPYFKPMPDSRAAPTLVNTEVNNVFKVNTGAIIGGRKRKTRKTKRSGRARN